MLEGITMPDFSTLTAFDFIAIAVLGFSSLVGIRRGFATEVLTLAAWAGAIFITLYGLAWGAQDYGRSIIQPNGLADILTAVVLFVAGLFACRYIAGMAGDLIKSGPVGAVDRTLGGGFGFLRGLLVISAAWLFIGYFTDAEDQPEWVINSQMGPLAHWGAEHLRILVPQLMDRSQTLDIIEEMQTQLPSGQRINGTVEELAIDQVRDMDREQLTDALERIMDEAISEKPGQPEGEDTEDSTGNNVEPPA